MGRQLAFASVLATMLVASACGGSTPTTPDPPTPPRPAICSDPAADNFGKPEACVYSTPVKDLKFPLPGTSQQGEVLIKKLRSEVWTVDWAVIGPAGWEVWVSVCFMGPDPGPRGTGCSGSGQSFDDPSVATSTVPQQYRGQVTKVRFLVWVAPKGVRIGFPFQDRDADFFGEVDWK